MDRLVGWADEVDRLRSMYTGLRSKGHHEQSIHIAYLALSIVVRLHGQYHPDTGRCLNELAMAYAAVGNYDRAEPLLEDALQLVMLFDGASSEAYATVLDNLAQAKSAKDQLRDAEKLHRLALESFTRAVGRDHPSYATCLGNLAMVCRKLGKYAEAERLYIEAVDVRRRAFGVDDVRHIGMLDGLIDLYLDMSRLGAAETRVKEVVEIVGRAAGKRSVAYGSRLKQLAGLYHRTGRHSDSAALLQEALTIDTDTFGQDHPTSLDTLARKALSHKLAGELGEAFRGYQYVMAHQSGDAGGAGPELAITKYNLALLHLDVGLPFDARRLLDEAIEILRSTNGENSVEYAMMLLGMAGVESFEGRHGDAESTLRRALGVVERSAGRDNEYYARCCEALAQCCIAQRRYDEADGLLGTSLRLMEQTVGEDTPAIGITVGLRGAVQMAKGRWASAEKLLRRAVDLLGRAAGAERTAGYIEILRNLGSVLVAVGREPEAIAVLFRAEQYRDRLIQEESTVAGVSPERVNQPVELLNLLGQTRFQSPELVSQLLEVVWRRKGIVAEAEFVRRRDEIYSRRDDHGDWQDKFAAISRSIENGEIPQAAELDGLLDALGRSLRYQMYPGLATAHREMNAHIMEGWPEQGELSREDWLERVGEYVGRAGSLMGKRDNLESQLRFVLLDGWLGEVLHRVSLQAVLSRLPERSALVEFLCVPALHASAILEQGESRWGPDRYCTFVVTPDSAGNVRLMDLGNAQGIDENIALLRGKITPEGRARDLLADEAASAGQEYIEVAADLGRALVDPLQPALVGRSRLFIAPDAQLYTLPFEILPLEQGRVLIDDYEITYVTAGRDLIPVQHTSHEPANPAVVIADPDYDLTATTMVEQAPGEGEDEDRLRAAGLHFTRLPGTHVEGRHIAELLGVEAWLGADAVEGRLKQQRSPVILHIASHGYFLKDQPEKASAGDGRRAFNAYPFPLLNSGLALAGANTWLRRGRLPESAEDGLLTAADLATMDLSGTELVVLSACDTGLGQVAVGQGVYGLRCSVGIAGARTLVMSLWNVPDAETQELMEDFYRRLKRGEPRSIAFRGAQLALRARRPDPYYWGAFICQGDSGSVPAL